MRICLLLALSLALLLPPAALNAQVPGIIHHQGRVAVGGADFTGTGQFKFALVNAAGTTSFWSNNLTSVGGSEPTAAVAVTVNAGLYSILLGDTTLPNMSAIPLTVFNNADVRLCIWFNNGVSGFQLLSPHERIAAVGYAMMAANVTNGAITSARIATGAVDNAALAAGAVQSGNFAAGAVGTAQIADGAMTTAKFANGAVGTAALADGTISISNLDKPVQSGTLLSSAATVEFGHGSFSVTFGTAFGTTPVVTLTPQSSDPEFVPPELWVQTRSTTAFTGRFIAGGDVTEPEIVDSAGGNAGDRCLLVVNGNPAMCYRITSSLKYARATNADGTSWGAPVTVAGASNDFGVHHSMAIINGNPAIAYRAGLTVLYVRATDANGTTWGAPVTIDAGSIASYAPSLAVVNGNPAISYVEFDGTLKYVRASNVDGTAWGTPVELATDMAAGEPASLNETRLLVVNSNPAIAYDSGPLDGFVGIKYIRATNANGTAWGAPTFVTDVNEAGSQISIAVVNGRPAMSYQSGSDLKFHRAGDANGAAWNFGRTNFAFGNVLGTSLVVVNGNPAISLCDTDADKLFYVRATNADGSDWDAPPLALEASVTSHTGLAVVNGQPAIGYNGGGDLKYIRGNVPSFTINWLALEP